MGENNTLPSISGLNGAIYYLVETLKLSYPNLRVMGFDSSRDKDPLPPFGVALNLSDVQVDRTRPTPQISHRIFIPSKYANFEFEGEVFQNVATEYETKQPLPVLLTYDVHTWCHTITEELQLDHAILKLLPERGVLNLQIDNVEYELPIMLAGIQNLDDLRENFRERIYRFNVEAWVDGNQPDGISKIISHSQFEQYEIKDPENTQLDVVKLEAKVQ